MTTGQAAGEGRPEIWPAIPFEEWADTCATLHMWTQIVGKVQLALAAHINHWWQISLLVSSRGLTTQAMPYETRSLTMEFNFVDHLLELRGSDGEQRNVRLEPRSVANFYEEVMGRLQEMGMPVSIWAQPVEIVEAIPFAEDEEHASYDKDAVERFWQALVQVDRVFSAFRGGFTGKASPSQFFWGSFDLAVTRFSGRGAPPHPGGMPNVGDWVMREAYSHELTSAGFWPGSPGIDAAFYSYAYPEPEGFKGAVVRPQAAFYHEELGEFVLPYEAVRREAQPDDTLMAFLQSTYEAAAEAGHWDRAALERK